MTKDQAQRLFEEFDSRLAWSQEEFDQGVKEAEEEGEEPWANPHTFNVRLDSTGTDRGYKQDYRLRITGGVYDTALSDWQSVLAAAEREDVRMLIQNNGIELS